MKTLEEFKQASTVAIDEFDFEFNYDYVDIETLSVVNSRIDELIISGATVEEDSNFILVKTSDLEELFDDHEEAVDFDHMTTAIKYALSTSLVISSPEHSEKPEIYTVTALADAVVETYKQITNT